MYKKLVFSDCSDKYLSPRWSGELLDCSMPMVLDTYSKCSYDCTYCFSYFQKSKRSGIVNPKYNKSRKAFKGTTVLEKAVESFNVKRIEDIFSQKKESQFSWYIKERFPVQWGGLSDPFDEWERRFGRTLNLLQFMKEIKYPISFSTKGVWWIDYKQYRECIKNSDFFNFKVSIISLNDLNKIERGVPSVKNRLDLIYKLKNLNVGGVTLRLRPFIIGVSDKNDNYLELIKEAYNRGITAVSTEFFCLESRVEKERFESISTSCGFDVCDFYRKNSLGTGYERLNYGLKKPYIEKMQGLCDDLGIGFYVSDAHHKEKSCNSCCCGLPANKEGCLERNQSIDFLNYFRGHFTEALLIAKEKGEVKFFDVKQFKYWKNLIWARAEGFNTGSALLRWKMGSFTTMYDYIKGVWNNPDSMRSPARYFGGVLCVGGIDEERNIIYKYVGGR